jgi:hypothetical protein
MAGDKPSRSGWNCIPGYYRDLILQKSRAKTGSKGNCQAPAGTEAALPAITFPDSKSGLRH